MELKDQVCSLDLAKKLKKLGVKQESYFYWRYDSSSSRIDTDSIVFSIGDYDVSRTVSAFTVAELGEMLPMMVDGKRIEFWKFPYGWTIRYEPITKDDYQVYFAEDDTEADGRAKMLIYLLENKLIDLE